MTRRTVVLTFGSANAKLKKLEQATGGVVYTFSLPAGWTCPGALDCMARANRRTGRVTDGPGARFRCFSVSMEARHPNVRDARWRNYELLKRAGSTTAMAALILRSLPSKATIIRIHVGGDFYSRDYLNAWVSVAESRPDVAFYAYSKSVTLFLNRALPPNLQITASEGGRQDQWIEASGLKRATVVFSKAEASTRGLEIDHDDSHALLPGPSFALLIHGTQPQGSAAAAALRAL